MSCAWFEKYKESADSLLKAGKKPVVGITANYVAADSRLAEAYYESVRKAGGVAVILPPSAGIDDIEDFLFSVDALVFSGGGDINPLLLGEEPERGLGGVCAKRDVQELVLMRRAIDKQMPVLAICRGMQVMAAATGGTLVQDIYSSSAFLDRPLLKHSQELDRDCVSHTIDIEPSTLLASILGEGRFAVNSFHHQAVASVGSGLRVSAKSPDGIIEAIESNEGKSLLGVQWHPESFHKSADNPMKPLFEWLVGEAAEYRAAREVHRRVLTLDSHCDTPMFFDRDIDFSRRDDRILVDSVKMRDGGLDAVIMAAYLPQKGLDKESLDRAVAEAGRLLDEIDERIGTVAGVSLADNPKRLYELKDKGLLSVMKGIENGYAIGDNLANIEKFARRGRSSP
ncbi:MAG: gamma-glutamyl-gamma-aminobutyrate hydrolase family protein [Bacteroidaceae bacterium]